MKPSSYLLSTALLVASLTLALHAPAAPAAPATAAPAVLGGIEPFLGQIVLFGGNFAPRGWAKCEGQLLPISSNTALFSLLGTLYGGDGETTFGLPDLRGRAPIGYGNGNGLSHYNLGSKGGSEQTTLSIGQMPSHTHTLMGQMEPGGSGMPVGRTMATSLDHRLYGPNTNAPMDGDAVENTGGGQSHDNRQPYMAMNYLIALQGTYPSEN